MLGTGGNSVTPRQLTQMLARLYSTKYKFSILLIGNHGVGKSTIVRDVARLLAKSEGKIFVEINKLSTRTAKTESGKLITDVDVYSNPDQYFLFYDLRLTELEPQDLMGLPRIASVPIPNSGTPQSISTYAPPSWAMLLSLPNIYGILFLDELTNVQRMDLISAAYKLFLDKSSGNLKFSDNVMVISAGNPAPTQASSTSTRSSVANPLPAPLLNRVIVVGVLPPTLEEWKVYMDSTYGKGWDTSVYEFLTVEKQFIWDSPDVANRNYEQYENEPTPRSYTNLALIAKDLHDNTEQLRSAAIGLLGSAAGTAYYVFVTETKKNVTADQLLQNPQLILTANLQRQDLADIAHSIAAGYGTDTKRVTNFFLTVLKYVQTLKGDRAELVKDFLLTIVNSLNPQDQQKLNSVIIQSGLSSIWNTVIR